MSSPSKNGKKEKGKTSPKKDQKKKKKVCEYCEGGAHKTSSCFILKGDSDKGNPASIMWKAVQYMKEDERKETWTSFLKAQITPIPAEEKSRTPSEKPLANPFYKWLQHKRIISEIDVPGDEASEVFNRMGKRNGGVDPALFCLYPRSGGL